MVLKIVVCGGGIGGLTTALCIDRLCGDNVALELFEQAPQYKEIGAGIGLGPNAAKVMQLVGLESETGAISSLDKGPHSHIWMRVRKWDSGDVVTEVRMPENQKRRRAGFHRAELLQVLYEAVRKNPKIQMHVNKRLAKVERVSSSEMKLEFQDGSTTTANLVIGADGIHSVVRSHYLKDDPIFSGLVAYRGLIPMEKVREFWPWDDSDVSGFWTQQGKHFMTFISKCIPAHCSYPISTDGSILNIVAFASGHKSPPKKESWVSKAPRSEIFDVYKDWDPTVQKLISLMEDEPGCWALYDRLPYKQWVFEDGKVVLMGDAAHSMLPHNGQGGSQSIEDAYVLARCLAAYFDNTVDPLESYLKIYEQVRLPRTAAVQASSREAGEIYEQLGVMEHIEDQEERYKLMDEKMATRMHWMWGYNVDVEIQKKLDALQPKASM